MDPLTVLRSFHDYERRVFERLLNDGKDPYVAKKIVAFWLWMETICHRYILIKIWGHSKEYLRVVAREAEACLACVENSAATPPPENSLPITSKLSDQQVPVELLFFHQNREAAKRGIDHFLNGVCGVVFEDIIEQRAGRNADGSDLIRNMVNPVQGRPFGAGGSSSSSSGSGSGGTRSGRAQPNQLLSLLSLSTDKWPEQPLLGPWTPMDFELEQEETMRDLFAAAASEES